MFVEQYLANFLNTTRHNVYTPYGRWITEGEFLKNFVKIIDKL